MGCLYSFANNKITVTGYTFNVPCTFTDLYNADKAGMLSLHYRTGIAGTDGAPVAVNTALRPADYVVLGGASNDLWITIANWIGTTATIQITGTDRDGVAQTENIVVNANGSYPTVNWYKTITHTQVIGFTATSFDYYLLQGQWGVVWKTGDNQFHFDCILVVGYTTGATYTYFTDIEKDISFNETLPDTGSLKFIQIGKYTHFTLGQLDDLASKSTSKGCVIRAGDLSGGNYYAVKIIDEGSYSGSIGYLYGCSFIFHKTGKDAIVRANSASSRIWNCLANGIGFASTSGEYFNNIVVGASTGYMYNTGTIDKITAIGNSKNFNFINISAEKTARNLYGRNPGSYQFQIWNLQAPLNLIDADVDVWTFRWYSTQTSQINRQYTFNLKVIDKDGNPINNASIILKDKDGNTADQKGFSTTTNASGVITEQTVSYGYYDQVHLDTLQSYSPHTITISKQGYLTYKKSFDLDGKVDWKVGLKHSPYNNIVGIN